MASSSAPSTLRVSTFNASLNRPTQGQLITDLSTPDNAQAKNVAEIIQRNAPDILLVNEFDFDANGPNGTSLAADLFRQNYLEVGQNGAAPVDYPYVFVASSNTGVASGFDLNNNGVAVTTPGQPGYGDDALGFGDFPGQFGMVIFSKYPIDTSAARTFQNFLWKDMPGARLPDDPTTPQPQDFYSQAELDTFRLSSKSHWDVPVNVNGETVHILASHPTPPTFDGPEDRNGLRNADEIRLFSDYVEPGKGSYLYDDQGRRGGLAAGERFVILGDQNADPIDGDSVAQASRQLLDNPLVNASVTPTSLGGPQQAALQGGANATQQGDPRFDTADFADSAPGNLRADYVLPSKIGFEPVAGSVFWPVNTDPLFRLVGTFDPSLPGGFPSSDHRLVNMDLKIVDDVKQDVGNIEFIGQATLPTGTTYNGTEVGGLSGITYDAKTNSYYAISDDRSQINPARFYHLDLDLADGKLKQGEVSFTGVTTLTNNGTSFPAASLDPEGIALTGRGLFISSEGEATPARQTDPFVRLFGLDGAQISALPIDAKFLPSADGTMGVRNNLAFEDLTVTPDQGTLYTATENAIATDGPAATLASGTASRILEYDLATNTETAEYVYITEPVADAPNPAGSFSTNGLVDLHAIDDHGTLLALERGFSTGVGNTIKLFKVETEGATDVSDRTSLNTTTENGKLTVDVAHPVTKELLLDFSTLGIPLDNIEGLTFGPTLPDGRQSLIVVSDNNFDATQFTQFLAFAVDVGPADDGIDVQTGSGGNTITVRDPAALTSAAASAGLDTVIYAGSGTVILPDGIENATLTGTGSLIGNVLNNTVIGAGDNRIATGAGNDVVSVQTGTNLLDGGAGNDRLVGGSGDDHLIGGTGADAMQGGLGDDTFFVDSRHDTVLETVGGGNDTVIATASYALFSGQEIETLRLASSTGNAALTLSGNAFDNLLIGNEGGNTLDGGAGVDVMRGLKGSDIYLVDNSDDVVIEGSVAGGGNDTVRASVDYTLSANVEQLVLTGSGDIAGTGNAGANTITGNSGANILAGGLGADTLYGGAGNDTFLFDTRLGPDNVDHIRAFSVAGDTLALDNTTFKALAAGPLAAEAFKDITSSAALDANDRILYDHDSGRIFYDADGSGSGARVQFAILDNHPTLTFQDFQIV